MGFDTKHVALFPWTDNAAELGITEGCGTVLPHLPSSPQFRAQGIVVAITSLQFVPDSERINDFFSQKDRKCLCWVWAILKTLLLFGVFLKINKKSSVSHFRLSQKLECAK